MKDVQENAEPSNAVSRNGSTETSTDRVDKELDPSAAVTPQPSTDDASGRDTLDQNDGDGDAMEIDIHPSSVPPLGDDIQQIDVEMQVVEEPQPSTPKRSIKLADGFPGEKHDEVSEKDISSPRELGSTTPLPSQQTPGRIKRMKDRFGKLPQDPKDFPILVTELSQLAYQSTPLPMRPTTRASARSEAAAAPATTESNVQLSRPQRLTRGAALMAPPPDPTPAEPVTRRRGVKLSEEEKAQREEEKAQKKAEKEAERLKKAEAKAAEKAKKAQEKEAEKAKKAGGKRGQANVAKSSDNRDTGASTSRSPSPGASTSPSGDNAGVEDASTPHPEPTPSMQPPEFIVQWTTLPQGTPSAIDPESSLVDELHSSSPARREAITSLASASKSVSFTDLNTAPLSEDPERTVVLGRNLSESRPGEIPRSESPLFLPSSSQYPMTPIDPELLDSIVHRDSPFAESEEEIQTALTRPAKRSWTTTAPFRRLSDLASQQLFSPAARADNTFFNSSQSMNGTFDAKTNGAGEDSETDEESDEDNDTGSNSDDDADKSHIPENRRAGSGVTKKKKSGLLSFA